LPLGANETTRLTSHREDLMNNWVRGINRLRALLGSIFPGLETAFDYSTRSALILLTGFCTPTEVRAASHQGLTAYLNEHGAWRRRIDAMATTALQAAAEQTVALPGEATTALLVKQMARKLLDLDREIKDTDKLITNWFREHPQARILESLPGMGPILGSEFLVAIGGDVQAAFDNPGRLAAYAGLVPVPKDSGRVTGNWRRPKRYNRVLRRVFYMAALSRHSDRWTVQGVLPAQAGREQDPYPGPARVGPTFGRRPVGTAARQPDLQSSPAIAGHRYCGLTSVTEIL
jgi:hypothetical protein